MATIRRMIPKWRFPEASERSLERSMQQAVDDSVRLMRSKLSILKFDATEEEIADAEEDLENDVIAIFLAVAGLLGGIARTIYKFNSKQWLLIAMATGGKDNDSIMRLNTLGANGNEPWYIPKEKLWEGTAQNSIVKLAREIVADWSQTIRVQVMQENDRSAVEDAIKKRYSIYGSWSKNRVSGIIGTFNSMLMKQRLRDAGVSKYIWQGMMDARERATHVALQDKVRDLDGAGIFPGEEYNCRCWAIPYWKKETENEKGTTL